MAHDWAPEMRAIVFGANGLVGRRVVNALSMQGHEVVAIARGERRFAALPSVAFHSVDLSQRPQIETIVHQTKPDVIVNCAAMTDVDGCERDPRAAYSANVEGVANLCRSAKSASAHLVHISTDYVFDGDRGPYNVDAIPNPRGVYALTKHMGEQTVRALCEANCWAIARTAVVYGWPAAGQKNFGSWLVDSLSKGQSVKLFVDQHVSPSHAQNVADMVSEIAITKHSGIWHTCGSEIVDRVTFGRALCERFGFDAALIQPSHMRDVKLLSPRPAHSGLVVDKTRQTLKNQPLSLIESIDRFYSEWKASQ